MSKHSWHRQAYENTIGTADDAVQGFIRDKVLGLPKEGRPTEDSFMGGTRDWLGRNVFTARPDAEGVNPAYYAKVENGGDRAALIANRSAQAGAVVGTAAIGVSTVRMAGEALFGGPADQPEPNQLGM